MYRSIYQRKTKRKRFEERYANKMNRKRTLDTPRWPLSTNNEKKEN
jgi:hypothetical protein